MTKYFGRGTDHVGSLNLKLRELMGFPTLAHELIQNADDPENTKSMSFDVRPDALVVDNDGTFSDCGQQESSNCAWMTDTKPDKKCDFHGFRSVGCGHKRVEGDTIGKFGIGFTAVYQLTDRPELISSGRHWILDELQTEGKRIEECDGCNRCRVAGLPGTRFILPWAMEESVMRTRLEADAIKPNDPGLLLDELLRAIPLAMLFLKRLDRISILRDGVLQKCVEREKGTYSVTVTDGTSKSEWLILPFSFDQSADKLRSSHVGKIEDGRTSKITLAIPTKEITDGFFCAFLPTQQPTGLPFHINADFFTRSDRKGIIDGDDFRAAWNSHAITAAADAFAMNLEWIRGRVSPPHLWELIDAVRQSNPKPTFLHKGLAAFPARLAEHIRGKKVVQTSLGQWVIPDDAVFLDHDNELKALPMLEGLGLNVVHGDLRFARNCLLSSQVGVEILDSEHLATALLDGGLDERVEVAELPTYLQPGDGMKRLWKEIEILLERSTPPARMHARSRFAKCAIAPAQDSAFWPCEEVYRADEKTISLFRGIFPNLPFLKRDADSVSVLRQLCPTFDADVAVDLLADLPDEAIPNAITVGSICPRELLQWFEKHKSRISEDKDRLQTLALLPIFPSADGLRPLTELSLPGDFDTDPLGIANLVDVDVLGGRRDFFRMLDATALTFETYVSQHVTRELQNGSLESDQLRALSSFLANDLARVEKLDEPTQKILKATPLVDCTDDALRLAEEVYFPTTDVCSLLGSDIPLVKDATSEEDKVGAFYRWLGVATRARVSDVRDLIETAMNAPPTDETVALIPLILKFQEDNQKRWNFEVLKQWAWLPARGNRIKWFRPVELYTDQMGYLFESQVQFLEIPANKCDAIGNVLQRLGVKYEPTPSLVVRHLLHCATQKQRVNRKVYDWLNERADSAELGQLLGQPCILLPDGDYVRPNHVFWKSTSFGRFRRQLPAEWRKHDPLYRRLSVRDEPDAADAIVLLCEIGGESRPAGQKIDEEERLVNLACWKMLETALARAEITPVDILSRLAKIKSVCTSDGRLQSPENVFFDDRTGLAAKFVGLPRSNVIGPSQVQGAWRAMEAAGVRRLSRIVETHLVEAADPIQNNEIRHHLQNLKHPLARVIDYYKSESSDSSALKQTLDLLDELSYAEVRRLVVRHTIQVDSASWNSELENTHARFIATEKTMYFTLSPPQQPRPKWLEIACELATLLAPDEEPGRLSPAINTVIDSDSAKEANAKLDILKFPDFGFEENEVAIPTSLVIQDFGDEPIPAGDESTESVPAAPDSKWVAETAKSSVSPDAINEAQSSQLSGAATPLESRGTSERSQPQDHQTTQKPPPTTSTKAPTDNPRNAETRHADEGRGESRDVAGAGNRWSARQRDASDEDDDFDADTESEDDADDQSSAKHSAGRSRQERQRDGIRRGYSNLKSFVMPDRLEEDVVADPKGHATRSAVGRAGVARVLEFERRQGRIPQEMPANHPGFDVKSRNKNGEIERYIEVKSFAGDWDSTAAGLTRKEFDHAIAKQDHYWLYIVERAQSDNPRIHRIKNPAGKADRFMFDDGWKQVAE